MAYIYYFIYLWCIINFINYLSFIRPVLEYADIIWDNISVELSHKLERLNQEAARIVSGGTKLTNILNLYNELGWEPLENRRKKHKIIHFHKMVHGQVPEYLRNLVPPKICESHTHNTRQADNINLTKYKTTHYKNSFLPSTISLWNSLPDDVKKNPSISHLKRHLNKNIKPPPPYFLTGSRQVQILHTRLRMNCSSLKYHLFSKNIVDSPLCVCGKIEDTKHYFLECPLYNQLRRKYLSNLANNVNTNLLLFGDPNLSVSQNKSIFQSVHNYIKQSKRFNSWVLCIVMLFFCNSENKFIRPITHHHHP